MGDYHDLNLKTHVLLLADAFERFLNMTLEYYGLDPWHYFGSPGLSWDTICKMTNIELKLISNTEMLLFIEKGMKGGISYISKRYSKANNKYIHMILINQMSILHILIQTIYMVWAWLDIFLMVDLSG